MTRACCSECGRPLPKPKAAPTVDTAALSDAQIYAHYKGISHVEDLKFHARTNDRTSSPELLADWLKAAAEAPTTPKPENKRRLVALLQRWRIEKLDLERAARTPAVGSPAWFEQIKTEEETEPTTADTATTEEYSV